MEAVLKGDLPVRVKTTNMQPATKASEGNRKQRTESPDDQAPAFSAEGRGTSPASTAKEKPDRHSTEYILENYHGKDVQSPAHYSMKKACRKMPNHLSGEVLNAASQDGYSAVQLLGRLKGDAGASLQEKMSPTKLNSNYLISRMRRHRKVLGNDGLREIMLGSRMRLASLDDNGNPIKGKGDPGGLGLNKNTPLKPVKSSKPSGTSRAKSSKKIEVQLYACVKVLVH